MVYFECQKCNETVKKPKLAKHLMSCGSWAVSCIDCSKVFAWNEWESHTSCISEAQKYEGKLYKAKESENKGQVKQDAWVEKIEEAISDPNSGINPQTKSLLQQLMGFNNIPRKAKPFGNFVKNSVKIWDQKKIDDMWSVISKATAKPAPAPVPAPAAGGASSSKPAQAEATTEESGWKRCLDATLSASDGSELPWNQLRSKMVKRYKKSGEANSTSDEVLALQALACIPLSYCRECSNIVKLPN
eukprot:TRINITY_DN47959_c0_g1_i1.p1 TRINITY_DN47959_c0_g1~~TRINITY_DN47959_c0_g1_i1.p1  ORF type:complete len:245 (-),score=55.62 TRINITY_DN47959_c0_g1_i1:184-918(-)